MFLFVFLAHHEVVDVWEHGFSSLHREIHLNIYQFLPGFCWLIFQSFDCYHVCVKKQKPTGM